MRFSRSTHLLMFLSLETLTSIIRTGLPILVELIDLGNSVTIFLSQMTLHNSHSPALLDLFLSSDASICSTMAFLPLGNSDHVVVSVSMDFPSYSQQDALFHCIRYDYSCADLNNLCDHLSDVPWEDIFKFSASASTSQFCEWVQVVIDVSIPHQKYQVKPESSPWFSSACAAAIVHRNHFFVCTKQINLLILK